MAHPDVAAAILAGGTARRFGGRDKSRLIVRGRSIIVRQMEVLQRVAARIFIVANDADRYGDLGVDVHPDIVPGLGAMGGVYTHWVPMITTPGISRVIMRIRPGRSAQAAS